MNLYRNLRLLLLYSLSVTTKVPYNQDSFINSSEMNTILISMITRIIFHKLPVSHKNGGTSRHDNLLLDSVVNTHHVQEDKDILYFVCTNGPGSHQVC